MKGEKRMAAAPGVKVAVYLTEDDMFAEPEYRTRLREFMKKVNPKPEGRDLAYLVDAYKAKYVKAGRSQDDIDRLEKHVRDQFA